MLIYNITVSYATKFIVSRRKKEFALYQLLGMERKKVSHLFFVENGIIGFIACIFGIILGGLISQIFTAIILNIFDVNYEFKIIFSWKVTIFTLILFVLMYLINIYKSSIIIYKRKIIDLLNEERINEKLTKDNKSKFIVSLIIYIMVLLISFLVLKASGKIHDNSIFIYFIIFFILISIAIKGTTINLIYLSLSKRNKSKKWKYHRINIVLLKGIYSQINSYGRTIGVLSVLLFFALFAMDFGLSMGGSYKANIKAEAPFDIAIAFDEPNVKNFNEVVNFIDSKEAVKDYVSY